MSTLPDIDQNNTSYAAFWNAIGQGGVSNIDPLEVTDDSGVIEYDLYDNGLEGKYNVSRWLGQKDNRECFFRVKDDGWVVAYFDSTRNFEQNEDSDFGGDVSSTVKAVYDLMYDWTYINYGDSGPYGNGYNSIENNTLERTVNSLYSQFSNSGNMNYSSSDVGLFVFDIDGPTNVTQLDKLEVFGGTSINEDVEFTYTDPTTFYEGYVTGYVGIETGFGFGSLNFDGVNNAGLTVASSGDNAALGGVDMEAVSGTLDSGQSVITNFNASSSGGAAQTGIGSMTMVTWG